MGKHTYRAALERVIEMGDELIRATRGKSQEEKALAYVRHADAVEEVIKAALKEGE